MATDTEIKDKLIVLFDGECNLCNSSVQFIVKRDKADIFRYASLQSEFARQLAARVGFPANSLSSIILVEGNNWYEESTAAMKIGRKLGGVSGLFSFFSIIPRQLRDVVYRWVARNRYRWFGKTDQCLLPTKDLRSKFLDTLNLELS